MSLEIEQQKRTAEEHQKNLARYITSFNDLGKSAEEQSKPGSDEYEVDHALVIKLQNNVKECIKMMESTSVKIEVLSGMSQYLSMGIDLEAKYEQEMKKAMAKKKFDDAYFNANDLYRDFYVSWFNAHKRGAEKLPWASHTDDDDVEVESTSEELQYKCMYSHTVMKEPMRCKVCKHVYDKSSLKAIIEQARKDNRGPAKCPVSGCTNKNLKEEDCKLDYALLAKIEARIKEMQTQATQAQNDAHDLDEEIL